MKPLLITLGVLLSLLILAAAGLALALDPLVLRVTRDETSKALGVPVEIRSADASLFGRLSLAGFTAANPAGYGEPRSIEFDRVAVKARVGSIFEDVLSVDEVTLERPRLTIEFKGATSNLAELMARLKARAPEEREEPDGRAFRIRRLRMTGAELRFRSDVLGGDVRELTLPTLELANLGTSEDAATMSEILGAVLKALATEAVKAGQGLLPAELLKSLSGDVEELKRDVEEKVEDELEKGLEKLREKLPKP